MHIVVGLLVAFIGVAFFALRNRNTRMCRWREDRNSHQDGLVKYHCAACGAEVFNTPNTPPRDCKSQRPRV